MRDPGSVAGLQHRFQGGDQSAGGNNHSHILALSDVMEGLAVGDRKQPALAQFVSHMHGQSLGSPDGLPGLTQPGLGLGSRARAVEAFGDGGHFMGQRLEEVQVRNGMASSAPLGTQRAHPLRGTRDWAAQTPAHNQQSNEDDNHHLLQHAQKSIAPD